MKTKNNLPAEATSERLSFGSAPLSAEGDALKSSALQKLDQARCLVESASEDMLNLEGSEYCKHYESAGHLGRKLGELAEGYRKLKSPTGVFKF